jgi:ubiquinone/menaquinone biosynthesis C-methylase UbiE
MKIEKKIDKIKKYWNIYLDPNKNLKRVDTGMGGLSLMHLYYNYLVSGESGKHYLEYFKEKYLRNKQYVIASLGCGNGHLERELVRMNYPYREINGFDINPELVKFSKDEVKKIGIDNIDYYEMDLNNLSLNKKYDLIIFFHSLHHVENLEKCLDEVSRSLTPEGILFVVDFVGPTRFQWSDKQLRYSQSLLDSLPDELKINLNSSMGEIKKYVYKPTTEQIENSDPSEAVRSGDILDLLKNKFSLVELKPMGGTLLNLILTDIAGNFDEKDSKIRSIILQLQKIEEILITEAVITSDFVFMVLKNK